MTQQGNSTVATIVTLLVAGTVTSFQIRQMEANQATPWMGLEERVNIYATMLWVAVLAMGLLRADVASRPRLTVVPRPVPAAAHQR